MENINPPLLAHIANWSPAARTSLWDFRKLFHEVAHRADVGHLDEALKWQQPAWRPTKPRTGSTLRMHWKADVPDLLSLYVDCKTDLASRMRDIYPDLPVNDGQRHIALDLTAPLPLQAVSHLAEMTFTYHRAKRG